MHFQLTEEQLMIQQAARDFAQQQCLPGVIERDEKQQFPRDLVLQLADLGFLGMMLFHIFRKTYSLRKYFQYNSKASVVVSYPTQPRQRSCRQPFF